MARNMILALFILLLLSKLKGKKMETGISRNNPGNIRPNPNITWKGTTGVSNGFLTFDTIQNGIRAIAKNAKNTAAAGYNTPRKFFAHYAPESDSNKPVAYAQFVADKLGIGIDDTLDFSNPQNLLIFVESIIRVENGQAANTVDINTIQQGIDLA